MFDSLTIQDAKPIMWLKRVFVFVIVVFLAIGMVSSYRAYVQVQDLELSAPAALSAGSIVNTSVVSSGRTTVDVEVDLFQGAHSQRLIALQVRGNELGFFDPRTRHGSESATLSEQTLSHFQPGRARLRAVATGRHQWFRLPPPTVRELDVEIRE
jgi:hypothetical protein